MKPAIVLSALFLALMLLFAPHPASAAPDSGGVIVVNSTADNTTADDVLTLREALLISNGGTGPSGLNRFLRDAEKNQLTGCILIGGTNQWAINSGCGAGVTDTINFHIPAAGAQTISLSADLPATTDPVVIDGFSQPGSVPNLSQTGDFAVRNILINAKHHLGFALNGGGSTLRGLDISNFIVHAVQVDIAGGNYIQGNKIHDGAVESTGIVLKGGDTNYIGAFNNPGRNTIYGKSNDNAAIYIWDTSHGNLIAGNLIGTDITGKNPGGNSLNGIVVAGSTGTLIDANVIAFNATGIIVTGAASGNWITSNSIFANRKLGIDLGWNGVTKNDIGTPPDQDSGPNNLQNFPVLKSATTTLVKGKIQSKPNSKLRIEFFKNPNCGAPSGYGQGKSYLGFVDATTDPNGLAKFQFSVKLKTGQAVSATAADNSGNTSEFSKCMVVQ